MLIIIDEFADGPTLTRQSKMLQTVYIISRHNTISRIIAIQKFNALHHRITANASELCAYRLRNRKGLDTFIDEASVVVSKKALMEL